MVVGCGFIGSRLVEALSARGEPPRVLTRSQPERRVRESIPPTDLHLGDAADPVALASALEGVGKLIFTAGGLLPAASEQRPDLDAELTVRPLRNVLSALAERPDTSLLYLSSGGTVYGDPENVPVGEDEPTRPRGVYGKLHVRCEQEILHAIQGSGLRARILRCSTVYGEGQQPDRGQGVIVTFLSHIERGLPIDLYGDGGTVRDYMYVGDLAEIMVSLLAVEGGPAVVNVGSGEGTSLEEVVRLTEAEVGRAAQIVRHGERGFDVHRIVLDVTRLRGLVEVEMTPLAAGISLTHRWLTALAPERA